jgi:DNA-binding NarL/FixJ family response regulator
MGIRVLLIDSQPIFRHGVKAAVRSEKDVEIVGETAGADEGVEKTIELSPDLVVMDTILSDGDAFTAMRAIRSRCPETRILVLTSSADHMNFRRASQAGAIGYILKDIGEANLVNAIRAAHSNRTTLSPTVAGQLIRDFASAGGDDSMDTASSSHPILSQREIDVLTGVVEGLSDKEIAARLFLSEAAVKTRLRSIYQKYGLRNRAHAAVFSVENGLLDSKAARPSPSRSQ